MLPKNAPGSAQVKKPASASQTRKLNETSQSRKSIQSSQSRKQTETSVEKKPVVKSMERPVSEGRPKTASQALSLLKDKHPSLKKQEPKTGAKKPAESKAKRPNTTSEPRKPTDSVSIKKINADKPGIVKKEEAKSNTKSTSAGKKSVGNAPAQKSIDRTMSK